MAALQILIETERLAGRRRNGTRGGWRNGDDLDTANVNLNIVT
jgi:hypothetical protein